MYGGLIGTDQRSFE